MGCHRAGPAREEAQEGASGLKIRVPSGRSEKLGDRADEDGPPTRGRSFGRHSVDCEAVGSPERRARPRGLADARGRAMQALLPAGGSVGTRPGTPLDNHNTTRKGVRLSLGL